MIPGGPSGILSAAAPARIVQSVSSAGPSGGGGLTITLPATPTAGNLLAIAAARRNGGIGSIVWGGVARDNAVGPNRGFTAWATEQIRPGDGAGGDPVGLGYRVATGDEHTLYWGIQNILVFLMEIAGAGSPAGFAVRSLSAQPASVSKSLGAFAAPTGLELVVYDWDNKDDDQTLAAGFTRDDEYSSGSPFVYSHPSYIAGHSTSRATPVLSGPAYEWAGVAVAVTP